MVKVIETNLVIEGLLREQKENNESFIKKTLMDLGVVIDGTFTFGTGITAFLPTVRELLKGGSPVMTEQDVVLLYITAMWILLKRNEDKIGKSLKIIRERGLTDLLAKVYDFLESTEDIVIKMASEVGYTASRLIDITAFTFMTFPVLDVLLGLIRDNTISIDNPGGYLKSILISIGILSVKNGFNSIIKKIRSRYGDLKENRKYGFDVLLESKEDNLYDVITTNIVKDIMKSIKKTIPTFEQTTIYLPEELNGELSYNGTDVSVEITISRNEELEEEFLVESFYSPEDDVIELGLELNPLMEPNSYEKIYSFLIEYIRHELEHYDQNIKGELPPNDDGLGNLEYYLQPHEIPAQVKGLNLRASKTKQSYADVVRKSVEHSKQRYGLTDTEASELYTKLLDGIEYQLSNTLLKEEKEDFVKKEKIIFDGGDVKVVAPLDRDTFCYYSQNTSWCDSDRDYIWQRCNDSTCYIVIDTRYATRKATSSLGRKNIIVNLSKIPLLIQKGDELSAYDGNSQWIKAKSVLSQYPNIAKLFKVEFDASDRLRYNMELSDDEVKSLSTTNKFAETIYKIMRGEIDDEEVYEYMGDDIEIIDSMNRSGERVEVDVNGITLFIDDEIFKYNYLMMDEHDGHYLDMAMSDGNYQNEEQDEDELNYMGCWFSEETYNKLMRLFIQSGILKDEKPNCTDWDDDEMVDLLERYFENDWENTSWRILEDIGYGVGYMRVKNTRDYVKDNVALPFTQSGRADYEVSLSWEQLLYIVGSSNINNLSEIKGTEILELGDTLESMWYDSYDWAPSTQKEIDDTMDSFIEEMTNKLEDGEYKKNMDNYLQISKDLGFKKKWSMGRNRRSLTLGPLANDVDGDRKNKEINIINFDPITNIVDISIRSNDGVKEYSINPDDLTNYTLSDELFSGDEDGHTT